MRKPLTGILVLALLASLLALPAGAAGSTDPQPQSKTVTLPAACIDSALGEVTVTVTYTGWLGELDGAANGISGDGHANDWSAGPAGVADPKIIVVKEGSEIRFTIQAQDPMAAYNYCYDGVSYPDDSASYGWDDCGGGALFYDGKNSAFPMQVYGTADGSTVFSAGPLFAEDRQPLGKKLSANQYVYTPVNGLATYAFQAKEKPGETFQPNGYTAKYLLGTVLTISDAQIREMQQTGTMTFLEGVSAYGQDLSYQHAYVGLAELLAGQPVPTARPQLYVSDSCQHLDTGVGYESTLTNTTGKPLQGSYALLTYFPQKYTDRLGAAAFQAQVQPIDVNLAPGESTSLTLYSGFFGLANANLVWISFEDQAERDAFLADEALNGINTSYYMVDNEQWLKDNFGITLLPAE